MNNNDELLDLYRASIQHCANIVLTNVDGGDDSQDYVESAIEIMSILNIAYRDSDDDFTLLRETFRHILTSDPYDTYASDAIPSEWDRFIDVNPSHER